MTDEPDFQAAFADFFDQRYRNVPPEFKYIRTAHEILIVRAEDQQTVIRIMIKGDNIGIRNPETNETYNFNMGDPEVFEALDLIMLRFMQEQLPDDIIEPWWETET